ncbi:hypothetical protein Droror1_Dr00026180 [Drosera rotundifolia]
MSHPSPPLKAVSLTHVRYTKGDPLGHFLAWISLIPIFISFAGFLSHFVFRRELQALFFALGLILSQFVNHSIKSLVKQPRPSTCALLEICDSHGWPSSHSQYMFFFAAYLTLIRVRKIGLNGGVVRVGVLDLGVWGCAVMTMYSRVYLGYHTIGQVYAGAVLGAGLGGAWFWVGDRVLRGWFEVIEESRVGRWLYLMDTSHIEDVMKFEYENARAARKVVNDKSK